jgi:sugar-specific transcriptional regulator TrmB
MARIPQMTENTLALLGLKEKDMHVYRTLLTLSSAPLRRIAQEASLNRGTAYDALKRLMDTGLVSFVDAKAHRYFTAEDPNKLRGLATRRELEMQKAREQLDVAIPGLHALVGKSEHRPAVRYYEGRAGVRDILEDVLAQTKSTREKTYRVYSSSGIRDLIAAAWPRFSSQRKKRGIRVKAIALGAGGKTVGLDERKWLTQKESAPTYIFIYAKKTAYVSLDDRKRLFGVIIEDGAVAKTQRMIFDSLWRNLS